MRRVVEAVLGKTVLGALIIVTLAITPLTSVHPFDPIKLLALSGFAFVGLGLLLANRKAMNLERYNIPLLLISGFMAWQLIVLVVSDLEKVQQIYGVTGRNTGLISYLGLSILSVVSMAASSVVFLRRFLAVSLVVGTTSLIYGVIQAVGGDPFATVWITPLSPVIGFLGNPNFQASLLGVLGTLIFTQLFSATAKAVMKAGYVAYLLLTLFVISKTDSLQGFLVLLIGSVVALGVFISKKSKKLGILYLGLALVGSAVGLVGILNKGPLASLLYKDSVTYRGDYWRAGWKMTRENPVFGVGLDGYGDWYRRSRSIEAVLRRGGDDSSNAAHNVYLDMSSYGGFPLFMIYTALMVLVVLSAIKVIKRSQGFNTGFVGLVAGWVAYQAQSIISINQIGLALWGWVLSGLIIGFEINTRGGEVIAQERVGKKSAKPAQVPVGTTVVIFVGLIIGVLVGMPPYLATTKYRSALETENPAEIQKAAYIWPLEPIRMIKIAQLLYENKLESAGLQVALDATNRFPENFDVWATLNAMKSTTQQQKADALAQMKRLDPLNPELK